MNRRFWQKRRVLITGHEGFLGSNLVKVLLGYGCRVTGVDKVSRRPISVLNGLRGMIRSVKADISNLHAVNRVIKSERPEILFHLAAEAIVGRARRDPLQVFASNIQGTWNILEACRGKNYVKGIIVASSDKAYGSSKKLPYNEETPLRGLHPYDASKSCEDILAQTYHNTYKSPISILRCGNIYGPGDFNFSRLIPDAIRCALASKRLVIRSDGTFTRDFVYVDDIVRGYMMVAEKMRKAKLHGEAFNLSNERPYSVLQVFKKIEKIFGPTVKKPKILNRAKDEIHDQYLSARKAKRVLGWRPQFTLDEGLKKTIDWYAQEADS